MAEAPFSLLLRNCRVATMAAGARAPYGAVLDAAVGVVGERIAFVGPAAAVPARSVAATTDIVDLGGRWVTPGLIDCHTHVVYGGDRSGEWELKLEGATRKRLTELLARRALKVAVDLPGGVSSSSLATRALRLEQGLTLSFGYDVVVDVPPGPEPGDVLRVATAVGVVHVRVPPDVAAGARLRLEGLVEVAVPPGAAAGEVVGVALPDDSVVAVELRPEDVDGALAVAFPVSVLD